ncbi:MAG: hemerythrin domain-containing protein [Proteobacteria bacterium]|nr:hemerythrin domain-containing protein [Pseudomonadota bacterium]
MATSIQMSNVIAALDRDHANMAKLLQLLESEILAIEVGKTPDYPLLQDIMRYMTQYPDRFHHPKEDVVFAQLVKRDPGARADVEKLVKEHVSIGLAGQKFDKLLRTKVVDSVDVREQLGTSGLAYIRALREHMLAEETMLFPLAMAVLTKKDWRVIDEKVEANKDPLFGTMVAREYQRLYRLITDQTETDSAARS